MSEHSYDPAFDDTRGSGRRAPARSVSRVVEPVVETHVEPGPGADDPGRTRLGVTLSREQREWVDKESRRRGVPKAAVVRDLIAHAYAGGVPPPGPARAATRAAVTVDDFGDPVDPLRPPPTVVDEPVVSARESAPRFRRQAPTVEHRVEPARLHDLPPGVGGARDTVPGPHGGNGHARAPERDPRLSAAYAHLPHAVGTPVLPMDGEIPCGEIPSGASVGLGVDGNVFGGVSPSQALVPAAAAAREMAAQPGVWMIVPGAGPDGAMGVVRVPLAGYGESSGSAGFFARMPAAARYFLIGLGIVVVLCGLAYLGSSAVANRYYFQEVTVAPGRSVFYRVDRWSGEMKRCRTDLAAVGVVC